MLLELWAVCVELQWRGRVWLVQVRQGWRRVVAGALHGSWNQAWQTSGGNGSSRSRECTRKQSALHGALPCSLCQGIPQSTSHPCLHDRMIDLLICTYIHNTYLGLETGARGWGKDNQEDVEEKKGCWWLSTLTICHTSCPSLNMQSTAVKEKRAYSMGNKREHLTFSFCLFVFKGYS